MQSQKARVVCVAGNSIESPRLLLNSASTMFPDGLANSSGQVGKNYMRHMTGSVYAIFDKPVHMYRGTTMAGIIQRRGAARSVARLRRRLRAGDAVARPAVHGGIPQSRRLGPRLHHRARPLRQHGRHVDRRRGHAAGEERASRCTPTEKDKYGMPVPERRISTTIRTTSPCATMPTSRARRSTTRSARRGPSRRRPIRRRTISAPTG